MSAHLRLNNIAIRYGDKIIIEDMNLALEEGEIGCLLGPSGCGKTTLLRTIAGFERPFQGDIILRGNTVASPSLSIAPEHRNVGMVFQDYALFPHLTIAQNIAFGLSKQSKEAQQQRVDELLILINLPHTKNRYPHQLSGGQQQRIALARALAPKPDILLLDEPFSNLDIELREQLAHDVRQLIKAEQTTAILVTHDQQEAFATEIEFYLTTPEWEPIQNYIQYSSMTDSFEVDEILLDMRNALAGAGMEVESANAEYGPGQFEINVGPADALRTADSTVLLKSIVKQVAVQHGVRATFMPKPWEPDSGNGLHIHTSLIGADGGNAFADSDEQPNELMSQWVAGILEHAPAMSLINSMTPNGYKRVRPYTFAPTHIHWGLDNRTVMARCMTEKGSSANRVEYRCAGADANPYVAIAAILAAGVDGLERKLSLPAMAEGDMYANHDGCEALPTTMADAMAKFEGSMLTELFGEKFSTTWLELAKWELNIFTEAVGEESDDITDWERARYLEHT